MNQKYDYFPMFISVKDKKVVLIGGGKIATRRAGTLIRFRVRLYVVAPAVTEKIRQMEEMEQLTVIQDRYDEKYLNDADFVLAATNDYEVNQQITEECHQRKIIVNNASNQRECDFYFPSIVTHDDLIMGISSGGRDYHKTKNFSEKIRWFLKEVKE